LSSEAARRAHGYLQRLAREVLTTVEHDFPPSWRASFDVHLVAFEEAIRRHYTELLELLNAPTVARDLRKTVRRYEAHLATLRAQRERFVAAIQQARATLATLEAVGVEDLRYPPMPAPSLVPSEPGDGLPASTGVYALWQEPIVDYVGKSVCLQARVRLGTHHRLRAEHRISYVELPEPLLRWAEPYYIGTLRPWLNGASGSRAATIPPWPRPSPPLNRRWHPKGDPEMPTDRILNPDLAPSWREVFTALSDPAWEVFNDVCSNGVLGLAPYPPDVIGELVEAGLVVTEESYDPAQDLIMTSAGGCGVTLPVHVAWATACVGPDAEED
jgi:hypothetical protein